jgi:hypothetical protein
MKLLLWLYPRDWRRRYGAEMEALLSQGRGGPREALDLLRGALDAHLQPQWPRRRHRLRLPLAAALGVVVAALASHAVAVLLGAADAIAIHPALGPGVQLFPGRQVLAAATLAAGWSLAAVAWRRIGSRPLFTFATLLALRFAADWFLLTVGIGLTGRGRSGVPYGVAASAIEVAAWGLFAVVVLRRGRLHWYAALAAGCVLELLLGSTGLSLTTLLEQPLFTGPRWRPEQWDWSFLPGYLEALRISAWATILTALRWRRGRGRWPEPPEGAPVPARPVPDSPQPLDVRGRRAG